MVRRLLGAALALALLDPVALFAAAEAGRHECTDHVCACARAAARSGHCHGPERESPGMQASCNHDAAPATGAPRSVTRALPRFEPLFEAALVAAEVSPSPIEARRSGFTRIDSPPPRSL